MQLSEVIEAAEYLKERLGSRPMVGVVLGTGLNNLLNYVDNPFTIPYADIPHFPKTTVSFHKGNLVFGTIGPTPVVIMQGRFHYYEGFAMQQIVFPVRVMRALGIEYLLLSNAAGGLNPGYKKGDLVLTDDHLNFLPDNPLRGAPADLGERFVDMSCPYNKELAALVEEQAKLLHNPLKKGVYVAVMGPNLETRAEYRWLRNCGADMVGMSTVPEVIVANQLGLPCAAVSVITDECDPDNLLPVNIAEIIEVAGRADERLSAIYAGLIKILRDYER